MLLGKNDQSPQRGQKQADEPCQQTIQDQDREANNIKETVNKVNERISNVGKKKTHEEKKFYKEIELGEKS